MNRLLLTAAAVALFAASPALAQSAPNSMLTSGYLMPMADALASKVIGSPIYSTIASNNGAPAVTSSTGAASTDTSTAGGATAAGANGAPAKSATDTNAQEIGTVRDLVMSTKGTVEAVVIGIGGVLGLGEKNVAVAYEDVKWAIASDGSIRGTLDTTVDALKSAPDFQYPANGQATKAGDESSANAASNGVAATTAPASANAADPQTFVNTAAVSNLFEIQSSQLAEQKATADNLKTFAAKMITDHTAAGQQMEAAAQSQNISLPTALDQQQQQDLTQLQGLSGPQFDQAYTQMQLKAHDDAVALFGGYAQSGHAGALKDFAGKTLPVLQMHQQMIHQIAGQ
jgi:putative membrane protein